MSDDLINTLEQSGEFDALAKLREGEPYFVLIGRDGIAPGLLDQWADANRRRAMADHEQGRIDGATLTRELRKSTQAEMIGCEMRAFKKGQASSSTQDRPTETYTGVTMDEETQRRDAMQAAMARSRSAINASVAELTELQKLMCEPGKYALGQDIARLSSLSDSLEPPRPFVVKS